jgi:predicted flap endonuclease-1-like 5' DNA nuclease
MNYLLLEIIVYLLIAGLIGFVLGWMLRDNKAKTTVDKETSTPNEETEKREEPKKEKEITPKEKSQQSKTQTTTVEKTVEKSVETESASKKTATEAQKKEKDELTLIKGIGPVLEKKLNNLGIYYFDQISSWSEEEQASIGVQLSFAKKVEREEWVKQAKELMQD